MKNQEVIEKQRQDLIKYMEEKDNEVLGYNNQLSGLQTRLDEAQSEAVKWESVWNHIKNTAAKKTLLLGRIKMWGILLLFYVMSVLDLKTRFYLDLFCTWVSVTFSHILFYILKLTLLWICTVLVSGRWY